jgi:hypothetical protein
VDGFGDEGVGTFIENTLKADGGTSAFARAGAKIPSENATSGWPRTAGVHGGWARTWERRETEEGSGHGGG